MVGPIVWEPMSYCSSTDLRALFAEMVLSLADLADISECCQTDPTRLLIGASVRQSERGELVVGKESLKGCVNFSMSSRHQVFSRVLASGGLVTAAPLTFHICTLMGG